ncbi:hypothetical protein [Micromonospora sp. IBHARD004]|uniref:hypothetical protein n=1 Tax=Micromonospora sp. IBHARD004 TaxID=3457764 RepID=UPI004058FE41
MTVIYVDLSHHDWDRVKGQFDWAAIRRATSPVLCLRATYGDPQGYNPTTRHFADMARGAGAAGFDVIGGYHNLIKGDQASINRQVDYLRRTLDGVRAVWAMLDVERYTELVNNGLWPRFDDVRQFVDRWHTVDHRLLAVYLPRWMWDGHLGRPDLRVLHAPLVSSNYGTNPDGSPAAVYAARGGDSGPGWAAYGGVTPTVWQYGSNVDCPGASGQTDCNAYRGTLAQLRALLTKEDTMTPAEFSAILRDPTVAAQMRALPWQYVGGGIPPGKSTLGVLNDTYEAVQALGGMTARQSSSPDEERAVLAALPAPPTADQVAEATVRKLGGQDPDAAAAAIVALLGPERAAALAAALAATAEGAG